MIQSAQRRVLPRLSAGALALALVVGQAASLVHFALVPHTTCLDHGLAVHADAGHAHGPRSAAAGWTEGDRDPDHGHDHCKLLAVRRDVVGDLGVRGAPTLAAPPAAVAPRTAAQVRKTGAVWRLAPKQSPPAA